MRWRTLKCYRSFHVAALKLRKLTETYSSVLDTNIPNTYNIVIFISCNRKNILIHIPSLNINTQALGCGLHIHPWKISGLISFKNHIKEFLVVRNIKVLVSLSSRNLTVRLLNLETRELWTR